MKKEKYPLITEREKEVKLLIADGKTSNEIAEALGISIHTVKTHKENLAKKLGTKGHSELTIQATLYKKWLEENSKNGEK